MFVTKKLNRNIAKVKRQVLQEYTLRDDNCALRNGVKKYIKDNNVRCKYDSQKVYKA